MNGHATCKQKEQVSTIETPEQKKQLVVCGCYHARGERCGAGAHERVDDKHFGIVGGDADEGVEHALEHIEVDLLDTVVVRLPDVRFFQSLLLLLGAYVSCPLKPFLVYFGNLQRRDFPGARRLKLPDDLAGRQPAVSVVQLRSTTQQRELEARQHEPTEKNKFTCLSSVLCAPLAG